MYKFFYKKPKPSKSKYEYKMLYDFETRKQESQKILDKYPTKIPIIVEKSDSNNNNSPDIAKHVWVIESDVTIGQFLYIIRSHIKIKAQEALFFFINNYHVPGTQETLGQVYKNHKDENKDGFLYITYDLENTFG